MKILIVDDNEGLTSILQEVIEGENLNVCIHQVLHQQDQGYENHPEAAHSWTSKTSWKKTAALS